MLNAVENLMDAFQSTGIRDDDELKKIKDIIIVQVLDILRQYLNALPPEMNNTTELGETIASTISSSSTTSTPCITKTSTTTNHRYQRWLSNDLLSFTTEVQPNLVDLINGYQDEIRMDF